MEKDITLTISSSFALLILITLIVVTIDQIDRTYTYYTEYLAGETTIGRIVLSALSGCGWISITFYYTKLVWNAWRRKNHQQTK